MKYFEILFDGDDLIFSGHARGCAAGLHVRGGQVRASGRGLGHHVLHTNIHLHHGPLHALRREDGSLQNCPHHPHGHRGLVHYQVITAYGSSHN